MALVYFDASALVRLLLPEPGTALAAALFARADVVVTSRIADTEVRAALAAGERGGIISAEGHATARDRWAAVWPSLHVVEVGDDVARRAADLVVDCPVPLRSGDALHVASALAVGHPDTLVAAWDEHVAGAARSRGLRVVP